MRYFLPRTRTLFLATLMVSVTHTNAYASDTTFTTSIYSQQEDKVEWDWSNWQEVVFDCTNYLALKKNERSKNSKDISYKVSNLN